MKIVDENTSMSHFHSNEWWEREIERKLADQEPENVHLDYKDKESLIPLGRGGGGIDKQKRAEDISKDVSSFINSDGGVLVYGVPETNDPNSTGGSPVPTGYDIGFQRGDIDKETIENLITSNIQPRPGPELFQVTEVPYGNDGRLVFVVEVSAGNGDVWQAKDKRYYKRFHYKAEPMEHYEINMVRNRRLGPDLRLIFGLDTEWAGVLHPYGRQNTEGDDVKLHIGLQNFGNEVAESALIEICMNAAAIEGHDWDNIYTDQFPIAVFPKEFIPLGVRHIKGIDVEDRFLSDGLTVASTQLCWSATTPGLAGKYAPLFKTEGPWPAATLNIGRVPTPRPISGPIAYCFWRLQASNMQTKEGIVTVSLSEWRFLYLNDCEKHWEFG